MSKELELPIDSGIGQRVRLQIGDVFDIFWAGFWTILNTAKGQFELKCNHSSLCRWEIQVQLDIKLKGEGQTPELNIQTDVTFSQKTKLWKMEQIEQGRRYNMIILKITWKSAIGLHSPQFIDFEQKSDLLDVMIRSEDGSKHLYANSGVLALNSPVLRELLNEKKSKEIVIPLKSFPALEKFLQFLHPPFTMGRDHVEEVLELASEWKMDSIISKYEEYLIRNRSFGVEASVGNIKLADKFKMKNLLEEVLWNDSSSVYSILEGNIFSTWARAAMFEFLLEVEDDSFQEDDDENDGEDDDDDDEDNDQDTLSTASEDDEENPYRFL
uniref:BTB domain-containing protein n=1 Tax=Caenorhabditis tropicalis TaxID=1561998 RepID=A0A1I7V0G8_9PELO